MAHHLAGCAAGAVDQLPVDRRASLRQTVPDLRIARGKLLRDRLPCLGQQRLRPGRSQPRRSLGIASVTSVVPLAGRSA